MMSSSSSMSYFDTTTTMPMEIPTQVPLGSSLSSMNSNSNSNSNKVLAAAYTRGPAFETAVASYASRILKKKSPPESAIDSSVGPYVASMLRSALDSNNNNNNNNSNLTNSNSVVQVENLSEYESLMELLEENCNMNGQGARNVLQCIAKAIITGVFDDDESRGQSTYGSVGSSNGFSLSGGMGNTRGAVAGITTQMRKYRSLSLGAENDFDYSHSYSSSGGRFRSLSIGNRDDENSTNMNMGTSTSTNHNNNMHMHRRSGSGMGMGMTNSVFFNEMMGGQMGGDMDIGPSCSKTDIADNTMIEEEPSFLFEEDEMPEQQQQQQQQQHGYSSSTLQFSPNVMSPKTMMNHSNVPVPVPVPVLVPGATCIPIPQATFSFTPLKPDRLIPEDLLGLIDNPLTPSIHKPTFSLSYNEASENHTPSNKNKQPSITTPAEQPKNKNNNNDSNNNDNNNNDNNNQKIATSTIEQQPPPQQNAHRAGNKKKKTKRKDMDLAACLFARPRSLSVHDVVEKSPKLKPMAPPPASLIGLSGLNCASATAVMNNSIPALFQKQLASAVQILLAMNYDLCEEAAHEAALVSNADVNVAQHVIDGALSAPPVCRHMLHDGCYRSDCQFSHDVDGHTCLFWLKGRCGKGHSCKFMHGFSEKLLDGVNVDFRSPLGSGLGGGPKEANTSFSSGTTSTPIAIKTTNLVQHNMRAPYALQSPGGSIFFPPQNPNRLGQESCNTSMVGSFGNEKISTPPLEHSPSTRSMQLHTREKAQSQSLPNPTFSFASIASKGYSKKSSFNSNKSSGSGSGINNAFNHQNGIHNNRKEMKMVRIPQDLWSPFYNRSSNAFHISDPLARYKEVSSSTQRDDVIDLHFQSIKTFPVVLSTILPEKLRDHEEIWIVTGSGHHVSSNSHQRGGGVLENAVVGWLASNDYVFVKGRDKNGHGGACLVRGRNR